MESWSGERLRVEKRKGGVFEMSKWDMPSVDLRQRVVSTNSAPWILVGAAVVGIGGWLYCDLRYGKRFGASVGVKGWSVAVDVGCQ